MEENGYPYVEDKELGNDLLKALTDNEGKRKKIIICYISISGLAQNKEIAIGKLREVFAVFKENNEAVAMIYHADPAIKEFLQGYDRQLFEAYSVLIERMKREAFFIYDESLDNHFLARLCDGFYGDNGNLMYHCIQAKKPVMCINYEIRDGSDHVLEDEGTYPLEDMEAKASMNGNKGLGYDNYDVLIVITLADYDRVKRNYKRLSENIPGRRIIFIGSREVGERVREDNISERFDFIDENDLIPYENVERVMKEILKVDEIPRGMVGWYYQQFLKMSYSDICRDDYYMTWDGDTIPCRSFSMFDKDGTPFFDLKQEYCENYFITLGRLFPGMKKCIDKSFISEHMLMKKEFMLEMIRAIEGDERLCGSKYYERILRSIDIDKMKASSFSEFETYGSYVSLKHFGAYKLRDWHSFRYCGNFFDPDTITEEDFEWLSKDFEAVSFEKRANRTPESMAIFTNPKYRARLSARQIVEAIQEESEGYKEVW
ncbi:MAG: DUF6492 family protein [Lachnospiraceae bacterium]|nr:DUF6492 family protein [Lachnospiraceae bacterium]